MHLTELIENNTCVAVALQTFSDGEGKTYELSAVKFKGWITVNGAVKDGVGYLTAYSLNYALQRIGRSLKKERITTAAI